MMSFAERVRSAHYQSQKSHQHFRSEEEKLFIQALPLCSPAREALALQERTSSKGWRQRSRTIGTCPTVKPFDGCAAEYPLRSFAPQSSACVEAAGRSRVRQFSLQLLPPRLASMAKWDHLIDYLRHPSTPPPPPLFFQRFPVTVVFDELFVSVVCCNFWISVASVVAS